MKNKNLKVYFIVFFIAAFLLAFGFKAQSMIVASERSARLVPPTQPSPSPATSPSYEPTAATFLGEYVCLPHRDTKGPQTLECASGLKLQDNTYIALDLSAVTMMAGYKTGSKLLVEGLYVPIQRISSDHWQKYNINGILQVKEVTQQ